MFVCNFYLYSIPIDSVPTWIRSEYTGNSFIAKIFKNDNEFIVSSRRSTGNFLEFRNTQNGDKISEDMELTIRDDNEVTYIDISPDQAKFAIGTEGNWATEYIYSYPDKKLLTSFEYGGSRFGLAFKGNDTLMTINGSEFNIFQISKNILKSVKFYAINKCAFSESGKFVARLIRNFGDNYKYEIMSTDSLKPIYSSNRFDVTGGSTCSFYKDSLLAYTLGRNLYIYNLINKQLKTFNMDELGPIYAPGTIKFINTHEIILHAYFENNSYKGEIINLDTKEINKILSEPLEIYNMEISNDKSFIISSTGSKLFRYNLSNPTNLPEKTEIKLLISPNPATDYITISLSPAGGGRGWTPEIFNIFGEKESTPSSLRDATPQEGNFRIVVSKLAPGVYFIKIGDKFEKFIKM
jgi:hypothetical protein